MAESDVFLTPKELAQRWGMSVDTLNNWRHLKRGPKYIKLSKTRYGVRYRLSDVKSYENKEK